MPDTSAILACTYGTTALELITYRVSSEAVVQEGFVGRRSSKVTFEADGELRAASTSDMSAKIIAMRTDLGTDGRDLIVTGLGSVQEYSLLAALCQFGGPFVSFEFSDGPQALAKRVKFRAEATVLVNGNLPADSWRLTYAVRPDGLMTVTRSGEVNGAGAFTYMAAKTIADFRTAHALPNWIVDYEYDVAQDPAQSNVSYRITARQTATPLPSAGSGNYAVSGTADIHVERTEQMRKMTSYEFDLDLVGDPIALMTMLRAEISGQILHESAQVSQIDSLHLRCSFAVLESADGDHEALADYTQQIQYQPSHDQWEEKTYIGADPILVLKPKTNPRLVQTGTAVAIGKFFQPPQPLLTHAVDGHQFSYELVNDFEGQSRWSYQLFAVDETGDPLPVDWTPPLSKLARASLPDQYVGNTGGLA